MRRVCAPLADVDAAVVVHEAAVALGHVVLPLALVLRTVGVGLSALAVLLAVLPLALVDRLSVRALPVQVAGPGGKWLAQ